jgi:hypothetical protein
LEEGLAFADGSAGWTVTLCSGAGWFAGFFPKGPFDALFADQQLCIAGSGSASGEAHVVADGYRVHGRWDYASGILHATAYTANCVIWKGGQPMKGRNGKPVIRPFLLLPGEVQVHRDWNAMGLVATGSHGFSVEGLQLGPERVFRIDAAAATDDDPLYRYPFLPLAQATLAANFSGMGQHFLDCCADLFGSRAGAGRVSGTQSTEIGKLLETARQEVAAARTEFYHALDGSWEQVKAGTASFATSEEVGATSHALVDEIRHWVDQLYPFAGLGAARLDTEINRVWRDLHTAGQHPLLVFP